MRKQIFGRQFKRDKNERKALFNGLISGVILKGRIETTEQKAKAIKPELEKLVTKAKKEEKIARRLLQKNLKPFEIEKMVSQIGPGFKNRAGGYTRIIKKGSRFNDNASMVILEWVEMEAVALSPKPKKTTVKPKASTAKKVAAKRTPRKAAAIKKPAIKKASK